MGEEVGCFLRAKVEEADQLVPPVNGWQVGGGSIWSSDPTLECSRDCRTVAAEVDYAAKKGDIAGIKQLQQMDTSGKLSCHQHYIIISIIKFHQQLQSCLSNSRHTIAFGVEEHIWRRSVFQSS